MRILTIAQNDAGQRLDKFLSKSLPNLPMSLTYKYIREKKIKVNRKRTEQSYKLQVGDTVELFIKDEFFEVTPADDFYKTLKPRLDILYEDEHLLLCDKRAGMIVHPDDGEATNTLIGHIHAYLYQKGEYDPNREQSFAPALCNRIDRNTGGIVVAAKTAAALRIMNEKIKNNEIDKRYLCAVHGIMEKKADTLTGYLIKDADRNTVQIYRQKPAGKRMGEVKSIVTEYKVLATNGQKGEAALSLLEVHLITGRTHQIRAHMASIGHPLLGDGKYGINRADARRGYKFQALYSYKLTFDFADGTGELGYLRGRTVEADRDKIWFLKEF